MTEIDGMLRNFAYCALFYKFRHINIGIQGDQNIYAPLDKEMKLCTDRETKMSIIKTERK